MKIEDDVWSDWPETLGRENPNVTPTRQEPPVVKADPSVTFLICMVALGALLMACALAAHEVLS